MVGEAVLVALWPLVVELDAPGLSCATSVFRRSLRMFRAMPGVPLQLVEATDAEERLAEDEERPPLADHGERVAHRTVVSGPVAFQHAHIIVAFCNPLV